MTGDDRLGDAVSEAFGKLGDARRQLAAEVAAMSSAAELEADEAEARAEARAWQVERRVAALLESRPPYFARPRELPEEAADAVAWARRAGAGEWAGVLWLGGVHGAGKTSTAWVVAEMAVRSGYCGRVMVVDAGDLWEMLAPPTDTALRQACADVDLLVLDDLGKGGLSEWQLGHLHWIMNRRTIWHRPSILTSEAQLKTVVWPATWSRIGENLTRVWLGTYDHRLGREITGAGL
jgi:IstB-like ATP binding protein